jgi:signal peptidase I
MAPGGAYVYAGVPLLAVPAAALTLGWFGWGAAWSCDLSTPTSRVVLALSLVSVPLVVLPVHVWWTAVRRAPARPRWFERWYVVLATCLLMVVAMQLVARAFVLPSVRSYRVQGRSMATTLLDGERIVGCAIRAPEIPTRLVVVYQNAERTLVARVAAGPGDVIEIRNHLAIVNGVPEPPGAGPCLPKYDLARMKSLPPADLSPVSVPAAQYFLLSDCRDNGLDSRQFGFIPRERILRRASWIWWSPWSASRIGEAVR